MADPIPSLEEVLVACQKSLARASAAAVEAARSEPGLLQGAWPVYTIDSLDIDLSAGLSMVRDEAGHPDSVLVDFEAPAPERSRIRFAVQVQPREPEEGPRLEFANRDPLGYGHRGARFRLWLVDETGSPVPEHSVEIAITPQGAIEPEIELEVRTDSQGRATLEVALDGTITTIPAQRGRKKKLRSPGTSFLSATCAAPPGWSEPLKSTVQRLRR